MEEAKTFMSDKGKEILFRPPRWEDLDELLRYANALVREDTFIDLNQALSEDEEIVYLQNVLKKIRKNEAVYISAFDRNRLIGSCQVNKGRRRSQHVGTFGIAIAKEYRGEGIGKEITNFTLALAKEKLGVDIVRLYVFANNQVAQKLYQSLGFQRYGELPEGIEYQGKRVNQILMYKRL